jgi:folate-binding protein YgfZ
MPSRTTRLITLSGPDAAAFANAQFSSDLLALAEGRWQWSGWLDPKGRVRSLLQVARTGADRFVAMPRGGDVEALAADLRRFVFRSKVSIAVSDIVHVVDGAALDDMHARERDDGSIVFGEGEASMCVGSSHGETTWYARHMEKGYAWLPDDALDALLPPALSMERIGAVAFAKGCFPGQEIAARLHFLGGHKKHLRRVTSLNTLREGQTLRIDGRDIGIVLMSDASASQPMSLVVLDDAAAQAETLDIDDARLHIVSTFDA